MQAWLLGQGESDSITDQANVIATNNVRRRVPRSNLEDLEALAQHAYDTFGAWFETGPVGRVLLVHADDLRGYWRTPTGAVIRCYQAGARGDGRVNSIDVLFHIARLWLGVGIRFFGHRSREYEEAIACGMVVRYLKTSDEARYRRAVGGLKLRANPWRLDNLRTLVKDGVSRPAAATLGLVIAEQLEDNVVLSSVGALVRDHWGEEIDIARFVNRSGSAFSIQ